LRLLLVACQNDKGRNMLMKVPLICLYVKIKKPSKWAAFLFTLSI
jgi:hypothetical protein